MKNKIFYAILICIIVAGAIVIGTMGIKPDIAYSKCVKIDVYLGKEYNKNEVEEIAKEIFGENHILVQQVEYYGDMFTLTVSQDVENIDEKVDQLNTKINEKYEIENKKEDIKVTYQPNIKLSSIITPYIIPLSITSVIVLVYTIIRFKKIGIIKTIVVYVLSILASEAVYLSILAISRIPINRLATPIGLAIYVIVITIVTAIKEKELATNSEKEKGKNKTK